MLSLCALGAAARSSKKFLGGLLATLLLAPIPAYAALVLGNTTAGSQQWASILIPPSGGTTAGIWSVSRDGNSGVSFVPTTLTAASGTTDTYIDLYASINSGSQINSAATTHFDALTVTGKVTISVQVFNNLSTTGPFTNLSPPYSNQFSNTTLPSTSTGIFGTPGTAGISGFSYIHIRFDLTPGSKLTSTATSSSPVTVVFTGT